MDAGAGVPRADAVEMLAAAGALVAGTVADSWSLDERAEAAWHDARRRGAGRGCRHIVVGAVLGVIVALAFAAGVYARGG